LKKKAFTDINNVWAAENFVTSANAITEQARDIKAAITIDTSRKKDISPNLMGIFFEDISYAADGGLYAELIQNRDFEYSSSDYGKWNARTAWRLDGEGTEWLIENANPIHKNNSHYTLLRTVTPGARLVNDGWDGIAVKARARYDFSMFVRGEGRLRISLVSAGNTLASCTVKASGNWQQKTAVLIPSSTADNASLVIEPLQKGEIAIDFISLFPRDTFKGRKNGLRRDIAEVIADLHPRFVRFPGGCATHGQGIDNIYHWQASVGKPWERQPDMNIWNYHQTRGLGFYEYFQFCEDIGAEPIPVLAAGVPCQNSYRGGNGQQGGIPFERELCGKPSPYTYNGHPLTMESYLQELLDLIEWANGDARTSSLAKMRADAGHPEPFNMKYLGIGNEDLISDVFMERYLYLINGVRKAHPEITIVGTVGPFWTGSDYEYGWKAAEENNIEIVDEHYYNSIGWFFNHRDFYDSYDRNGTKVYFGEWASWGNNVSNALVEAAYLTNIERNADVVVMSSYAPLLAKENHTNWNPDLIYFNNTEVRPTANYDVQKAFGQNAGDKYIASELSVGYSSDDNRHTLVPDIKRRIDHSVVYDSKSGDYIIKIVSTLPAKTSLAINLGTDIVPDNTTRDATLMILSQPERPDTTRQWALSETHDMSISSRVDIELPPFTFAVMRVKAPVSKSLRKR
ncbi:MAG: alpha-L-arabinofuranosidase C-terminal domain-containing protein, partial [Prevotella sp.]